MRILPCNGVLVAESLNNAVHSKGAHGYGGLWGGWPTYNSTAAQTDSGSDGIPDDWLTANYPGKTANQFHESGYSYLEMYINSLVQDITVNQYIGAISTGINDTEISENEGIRILTSMEEKQVTLQAENIVQKVFVSDLSGKTVYNQQLQTLTFKIIL